ncbi:MAG TPA: LysM peptidoglycan-binding domain-containing protein [Gaiellaceae bacterium]
MPPARDSRRRAAHVAAPFLFLAAVTLAVLLIRAGLESGSSRPKTTTSVQTQTAPARTSTTKHRPKPGAGGFYIVQTGDSFSSISVKTGVSISDLERLNPGVSSNALHVGQKLRVK